jgi:hypothetical protein
MIGTGWRLSPTADRCIGACLHLFDHLRRIVEFNVQRPESKSGHGAKNRRKPILPSLFLCCISAVEFDIFREVDPLSLWGHLFDSVGSVQKVRQLVCEIEILASIELEGSTVPVCRLRS